MIPGLLTALVLSLAACGSADTPPVREAVRAAAAPVDRTLARTTPAAQDTSAHYIAHGGCPFECCQYGSWTFEEAIELRAGPSTTTDSVGAVASNVTVRADSGLVIVDPVGLVLITAPTAARAVPTSAFETGDTLFLLDYVGEGVRHVRWRGRIIEVEEYWDDAGTQGARLVREPRSQWWVHVSDKRAGLTGWVLMPEGVMYPQGSDACG